MYGWPPTLLSACYLTDPWQLGRVCCITTLHPSGGKTPTERCEAKGIYLRLIYSTYTYRLCPNSKCGASCWTAAGALSGYAEQISWNFTRLLSWASKTNPGKLSSLQCIHPSQPAYSLLQSDMMHLFSLTVRGWNGQLFCLNMVF